MDELHAATAPLRDGRDADWLAAATDHTHTHNKAFLAILASGLPAVRAF